MLDLVSTFKDELSWVFATSEHMHLAFCLQIDLFRTGSKRTRHMRAPCLRHAHDRRRCSPPFAQQQNHAATKLNLSAPTLTDTQLKMDANLAAKKRIV